MTDHDPFRELTWDDLTEWAGSKTVSRGRSYQKAGRVLQLEKTPDNRLVAWVAGREKYATMVGMQEGRLTSRCSCPYLRSACKHAVAVVVDHLHLLKQGAGLSVCDPDDERLAILAGIRQVIGSSAIEEDDVASSSFQADQKMGRGPVAAYLASLSKEELAALIHELMGCHSSVGEKLKDLAVLASGEGQTIVKAIREEIGALSAEPGWSRHWSNESYVPDYSRVRERLEGLLTKGHADDVLALGRELLDKGSEQVGMSEDEGETADEIASVLDVVFRALPLSSMTPVQQMLWVVDADLKDEFDLCRGARAFWDIPHSTVEWSGLADGLIAKLRKLPKPKGESRFGDRYRRDRLSNWVIRALEESARWDEIIPLCREEAPTTASYERLVKLLVDAGMLDEAEKWIQTGIEATREDFPGIAAPLRKTRLMILEEREDWPGVSLFRAEEFLENPSLESYKNLREASGHIGVWETVRNDVLRFLETGKVEGNSPPWPGTGEAAVCSSRHHRSEFPLSRVLIDLHIEENNPEEVLRWHGVASSERYGRGFGQEDRVARAVSKTHPDHAVAIWKQLAEKEIAQTNPNAYLQAGGYLLKMRQVLREAGRNAEWSAYIVEIRRTNARKRRLMEVLDGLDRRPIVEQ
ncbi:MAG: SWIM zinc finger domain-containing protein [Syntrophobacteraceae bacterium]